MEQGRQSGATERGAGTATRPPPRPSGLRGALAASLGGQGWSCVAQGAARRRRHRARRRSRGTRTWNGAATAQPQAPPRCCAPCMAAWRPGSHAGAARRAARRLGGHPNTVAQPRVGTTASQPRAASRGSSRDRGTRLPSTHDPLRRRRCRRRRRAGDDPRCRRRAHSRMPLPFFSSPRIPHRVRAIATTPPPRSRNWRPRAPAARAEPRAVAADNALLMHSTLPPSQSKFTTTCAPDLAAGRRQAAAWRSARCARRRPPRPPCCVFESAAGRPAAARGRVCLSPTTTKQKVHPYFVPASQFSPCRALLLYFPTKEPLAPLNAQCLRPLRRTRPALCVLTTPRLCVMDPRLEKARGERGGASAD